MPNIAIVLGSFHKPEVREMLDEARSAADGAGLTVVEEVWVPGSVEKPLAMKRLLMRDDVDAVVVLGIIERGETKHGFVMGQMLMNKVADLQLEFMKPIGLGVLGPEILPDQIQPRLRKYARKAVDAVAVMSQ